MQDNDDNTQGSGILDRVSQAAGNAADAVKDASAGAVDKAQDAAETAKEKLGDDWDATKDDMKMMGENKVFGGDEQNQ